MPWGEQMVPFTEHFEFDEVFTATGARLGSSIRTDYGDGTPVLLDIQHPSKGGTYSIFGQALVSQVERLTPADFPARIAITKTMNKRGDNEYKEFVTEDELLKRKGEDSPSVHTT